MRVLQSLCFLLFLAGTIALAAGQSQETTNAITARQLQRIEMNLSEASARVDRLEQEVAAQKSLQDRIIGLGAGIGVALTTLQGLLVILTFKNGGKRNR